jgi:hypothetical protein
MKKLLFILILVGLLSCSKDEQEVVLLKVKIGVICKDSTRQVWNQKLLIEQTHVSAVPCSGNGGISSYIYE